MISFGAKKVGDKLLLRRWFKLRTSDKRKRVYDKIRKYRKQWWHFKTRWDIKNK